MTTEFDNMHAASFAATIRTTLVLPKNGHTNPQKKNDFWFLKARYLAYG
jgi:hypothetical protein